MLTLSFLFVMAFCLRLYSIFSLPVDYFPVRQYHSALLARGFYESLLTGELVTLPPDGIIEPPILELIASFSYLIFGGEYLWIPRLLSATFWVVGGVFLYQIAKKVSSPNAAVFSVFFYLFVPFSILPSRAFMPESLLIMLLLISIFTIVRYHEQPSTRRMLVAALASSLVVFAKPVMCFFQIFGAFVALTVYRLGVRRTLTSTHLLLFTALSVLPAGLYYLYGTFIAEFLNAGLSGRVRPDLLLEMSFWLGWGKRIWVVVGLTALIGALLGTVLLRPGLPRALMIGLWGGYFLFGLTYTYHVHTHDYYSLQLIPVVALSLAPLADLVIRQLNQLRNPDYPGRASLRYDRRVIVIALLISALILDAVVQVGHGKTIGNIVHQDRFISEYSYKIATYREIGEVADHSHNTLLLFGTTLDYGFPLLYHGQLSGALWPRPHEQEDELSSEERFNTRYSEDSPEYFIISTKLDNSDFWESEEYEDLRDFLTENFPIIAQGEVTQDEDYVVFDLREKN